MRMEELSENRYIKGTDTVEKYVLNLVRDFFKQQDFKTPETSREYIIEKAIERMKEELSFEDIGVLTITLPDGTQKTGVVNVTLEDLGGEPSILPKRSAFNVPFGNKQNTACEGNDPRLSDKRTPLGHQHGVDDIIGLQGLISTLQNKIDRVSEISHKHENLDILSKLIYTGNNTTIDLSNLGDFDDIIKNALGEIENKIIAYRKSLTDNVTKIDSKVANLLQDMQTLDSINQKYLQDSKTYTDSKVSNLKTSLQGQIDNLVTRELLTSVIGIANNVNTLVGSMDFPFSSVLHHVSGRKRLTETIPIDSVIIDELTQRGQTLRNCQIECFIEYINPDVNKKVKVALPYITSINNVLDGSLRIDTLYSDNKITITLDTQSERIASELLNSRFIYNVYSTQPVTL